MKKGYGTYFVEKYGPKKVLFDKNTSQSNDKNVTPTPPIIQIVSEPTPEAIDYETKYNRLLDKHRILELGLNKIKTQVDHILGV